MGQDKQHQMAIGDYDVDVEIGPSYNTRRQEAAAGILEYIKYDPGSAPFVGDILARNMDSPDKKELEERLRFKAMAAGVPIEENSGNEDIPPAFKAMYDQQSKKLEE